MEQAPRHGPNLVEELKSGVGLRAIGYTSVGQQAKECVHLLRRSVGDSPVIEPISTSSSVTLGEIGGDRGRRPDHLVRE
jgi:hypothetical protein